MMGEQGQKCEGEKVKLVLYQTEQNVGGKLMMMPTIWIMKYSKDKFKASYNGNLKNALKGRKNRFKGHFKTELKEFHNKKGQVIERNLTCTKDLEALIDKVIETRKVVNPLIIVGCDGGLGSFLVTLVITDRTKDYKLEKHKPTGFPGESIWIYSRLSH